MIHVTLRSARCALPADWPWLGSAEQCPAGQVSSRAAGTKQLWASHGPDGAGLLRDAGHPGAGSPDLLRRLLARGIPVVVQQRLQSGSNVAHFRTVYGDQGGRFLISDPLRGPGLQLSEAELMALWHFYNGESLGAYPPAREGDVRAVLGEDFRAAAKWRRLRSLEEQNIRAQPNDPYSWWGLGKANLWLGNVQAAATHFDRAVALGVPMQDYLYRQEAFEAWTKAGEHHKTLTLTQRALQQFPDSKELRHFRDLARRALDGNRPPTRAG